MKLEINTDSFDAAALLRRLQDGETNPAELFRDLPGADVHAGNGVVPLPGGVMFRPGAALHATGPGGQKITRVLENYDGDAEVTFTATGGGVMLETGSTEVEYESTQLRTDRGQLRFYDAELNIYRFDQLTFSET